MPVRQREEDAGRDFARRHPGEEAEIGVRERPDGRGQAGGQIPRRY